MRSSGLIFLLSVTVRFCAAQSIYELHSGKIHFISKAPLETIEATSGKLKGLVDIEKNSFAFSIELKTFDGFNSALQKEHFNENYLESDTFPKSTFKGKLIDKFDPAASHQLIRAKGFLEMHGISKERIIQIEFTRSGLAYKIKSDFNIMLEDHDITIPKIVYQKISEIINVQVTGDLILK